MSDHEEGPGWWLASDGRWYPPDQAPPVPPPDTWSAAPVGPPPRRGMSGGAIVGIVVACVIGVLLLAGAAVALLGSEAESSFQSTGTPIEVPAVTVDPADVPEGFAPVVGDGVSVAVPSRWSPVTADDLDMTEEGLQEAFPDADPALIADFTELFAQGAVLVAVDTVQEDDFSSNINILYVPGSGSLADLEPQVADQLATVGGEVISTDEVDLPAGPALRVEYTIGSPGQRVEGVQHYVRSGGGFYVSSVTAASGAGELADQIMETFTVDG
jgi:hypothetical protein